MKNWEDRIMYAFYGLFGTFLGFLVFMMALGGWRLFFLGRATRPWNGLSALLICLIVGGGWGLVAYKLRDREFGSGAAGSFEGPGDAVLFGKRLMVVVSCLAALYFIVQLARGIF